MSARRFGTQSLVRLLGNWQETSSRTPLWRQLAEALRLLILDGRLTLQTRLPGERELAAALNVSRTTIASALGQLREAVSYTHLDVYKRQGQHHSQEADFHRVPVPGEVIHIAIEQIGIVLERHIFRND